MYAPAAIFPFRVRSNAPPPRIAFGRKTEAAGLARRVRASASPHPPCVPHAPCLVRSSGSRSLTQVGATRAARSAGAVLDVRPDVRGWWANSASITKTRMNSIVSRGRGFVSLVLRVRARSDPPRRVASGRYARAAPGGARGRAARGTRPAGRARCLDLWSVAVYVHQPSSSL